MGNAPLGSTQYQNLAEYAVNSNGSLTTINGAFEPANAAHNLFRDPVHKFLYVVGPPRTNFNYNVISAYSVDSKGTLTAVPGSPFNFNQQELGFLAFRPDGKFVYATDFSNTQTVHIISADPTSGQLLQEVATTTIPSGANASVLLRMAFDTSGHYLYFANAEANTIAAYSSDPASGALTPVANSPFRPRTATTGVCSPKGQICGAALAISGNYLYYGSIDFAGIAAFQIDPSTGALTELASSPFLDPAQNGFQGVTTPNGSFLYVMNANGTLAGYMVNSSTGTLTQVTGLPTPKAIGEPVVDDSGMFLYVGGALDGYQINQTTGALTPVAGSPYNPPGVTGITIVH
jgi:6-phosphogluconolactonase (cycloisomerase 2 family)